VCGPNYFYILIIFMHWLLDPLQKHYADFEGRIGRKEFWMFVLCVVGIQIVLEILPLGLLASLISLGFLVPNLAMGARRLHDTGRSGWLQLLMFIPIIGWIILILWLAEETKPADNEYGAPAKTKLVSDPIVPPVAPDTDQKPPVA
jgi:uncharacterized membrane protein YhaH (DUF805 family)